MGGGSGPPLAAAVSNAGGLGILGAAACSPAQLDEWITATRSLTDRPFGIDTLQPASVPQNLDGMIASEGGRRGGAVDLSSLVSAEVLAARDAYLEREHLDAGVDALVAQGHDGGGHNSPIGTMALLPQAVDEVAGAVPVIGAGGIADGRAIAAGLMLGCSGVWIGTRFLATNEALIPQFQKEAIVAAHDKDTIVSRSVTGKPARMLRGSWAEVYERGEIDALPMPLQSIVSGPVMAAAFAGQRADVWPGFAGQGAGLVQGIVPAADVMADLVADVVARLDGVRSIPGLQIEA
jgi:NAD(P)H-dependent flavin oxidoreductase YrpB (nitropropane dioxygenase family)